METRSLNTARLRDALPPNAGHTAETHAAAANIQPPLNDAPHATVTAHTTNLRNHTPLHTSLLISLNSPLLSPHRIPPLIHHSRLSPSNSTVDPLRLSPLSSFVRLLPYSTSSAMLVSVFYLFVALIAVVGAANPANNKIIFDDYTSHITFTLPTGTSNPADSDVTYNTATPMSITFGLNWNGDLADDYSAAVGTLTDLTITPLNNPTLCALGTTSVVLNAANPACNYTASWTVPFTGVLSITYNTGSSPVTPSAQQISISFINSAIVGDPQFVGLRGQQYQVHGIDGAVYNIVSESNTQVNSRFVFLTEGQCPMIAGQKDVNCWSHPGSYLGEMSFQAVVDGKLHAALVQAGSASKGFAGVQMDGKALKVGDKVAFGDFSVSVNSAYSVTVITESFEFQLSNSDMFINQALRLRVPLSQVQAHGLIGQTHSVKTYTSPLKFIDGDVDDYVIQDNDIFGSDFVFNKFQL